MMLKKLCVLLLVAALACSFFGCGEPPVTLNGVDLKEYAIVYSDTDTDYAQRAAEYIRDQIRERTGLELPLQEDSQVTAKFEIVVGNTQRQVSQKLEAPSGENSFAVLADGNQIGLEGEYFYIAAAAYHFANICVPETGGEISVPQKTTVCQPATQAPNNSIILIGDGMGMNHTKLFEQPPVEVEYSDGEDLFYGHLLPCQGMARTASLTGVTDSAAGGTALATGYKTYNGNIGLDQNGQPVKSLTELAMELGKATAVMSTETETGATPAAFSAHAEDREETKEIVESQLVTQEAGTILNCGFDVYQPALIQRRVEQQVLDTLSKLEEDPDGFFMMYEEAHIDKHSHNNDLPRLYQALARFNQVIGLVMEYAFYHPDTFVLITADHETGDLYPNEQGVMTFHSDDHTGQDVPVFVYGQGSSWFDGVTVENVQIPKTIAAGWGVSDFGDPTTQPALS